MLFDSILKEIGEFGWYQGRVYILATLPSLLVAFETLSVIFIFYIPHHRCALPGYDSDTFRIQNANHSLLVNRSIPVTDGELDQCHVYNVSTDDVSWHSDVTGNVTSSQMMTCQRWVYDRSVFESTIATDMDVVCHRNVFRASSNMVAEIGTLCGTFLMGFVADRFGRKLPFYVGGLALAGGGFGIAFTQNVHTLNICRFLLGVARITIFVNGLVIGMEIVGPTKRAWAGVLIDIFWCLGEFLLVLVAYFVRNWRYLEIIVSVPSLVLLLYWWLIPESPRWLMSRGRTAEALEILKRIARSNHSQMPPVEDASLLVHKEHQVSLLQALKSKVLLFRAFVVLSNMFVVVVAYYGLTLNISNLSGDVFTNFALSAVLETLAYAACLFLLDRTGRKPLFLGSMLMAGLSCTASFLPVLLQLPLWTLVGLSMLGRFSVCVAFATIYVYAAEIYPTVVRSSAMGVGVTFSRFGGVIAPYIADVGLTVEGKFKDALPLLVMGIPALLVSMLALFLPETCNANLPETVEDLERADTHSCLCCRSSVRKAEENGVTSPEEEQDITAC